jgi:hypothetical protein
MIYRESPGRAHAGRVLAERSPAFASEPTPDQIECYYPDFCPVNRLIGDQGLPSERVDWHSPLEG